MRKLIMSGIGLFNALLYLVHCTMAGCLLFSHLPLPPLLRILGRILISFLLLHAVLALPPLISKVMKSGRLYAKQNFLALLQYGAGILLIVFALFHVFYLTHQPGPASLVLISLALLAAGIHISLGVPKSIITFGLVREDASYIKMEIGSIVLFMIPTIYSIAAFISYYPNFYGGS